MAEETPDLKASATFRFLHGCFEEARQAKFDRMQRNQENWDCYNLKQDFGHKKAGQSKEFLPKQANAVEQTTSFLQQGLVDLAGDWYSMELEPGIKDPLMSAGEIKKLLTRQLNYNDPPTLVAGGVKNGLLESLMIYKVHGELVEKVKFVTRTKKNSLPGKIEKQLIKQSKKLWRLKISTMRADAFYPDPTGRGLYEQEVIEMDLHQLKELAKKYPEQFDADVIKELQGNNVDMLEQNREARQSTQNVTYGATSFRKVVRFIEHWGTILDPDTGEVVMENALARFTAEGHILTKPMANPNWHQESPYVWTPILYASNSVWPKAFMDAATRLNLSQNELFNLMLDGGIMSVFGIKQLKADYLEDQSQVDDGIAPATTLLVSSSLPPGEKVLERVDTGTLGREAVDMFRITDSEFQQSSLSSDLRNGQLPERAVKATEVVAAQNSIASVFNGLVKMIEQKCIANVLRKSWMTVAQNMNDLDQADVKALLGEDRANQLASILPEDRFAKTALGTVYKVFGLSQTLNKIQDFRKVTTLLQTIGANPVFAQEFQRKFSVNKMLGKVIRSLDIDTDEIKADEAELAAFAQEQNVIQRAAERAKAMGDDKGKQVADMANTSPESGAEPPRAALNVGMTNPM